MDRRKDGLPGGGGHIAPPVGAPGAAVPADPHDRSRPERALAGQRARGRGDDPGSERGAPAVAPPRAAAHPGPAVGRVHREPGTAAFDRVGRRAASQRRPDPPGGRTGKPR